MLQHLLQSRHRALIFDCDGTIADTMGIYHAAWNHAIRTLGGPAPMSWEVFCANGGRAFHATLAEYNAANGCQLPHAEFARLAAAHADGLLDHCKPVIPVLRLILSERKRSMAVASSGQRGNVHRILRRLEIFSHFQAIVSQEDVDIERLKPAPDLFLLAAERLGVRPGDCLVFEDSPLGAAAAAAAGMEVQVIPRTWWDSYPYGDRPAGKEAAGEEAADGEGA
jgi:HAD superfamily hydrolase (TIGR01509 family)